MSIRPDIPPSALRDAYISLIVDIMYHAIKDKRLSNKTDGGYADIDHRTFCNRLGFADGDEELRAFARSRWFKRLFQELEFTRMEDVRNILSD
ncbi:MAG: hypothetical protein ACYSW6_04950 [Planctomycetota bacterium]|jgi:hypothetical protein